jgi:hypothetical protein
MENNSIELKTVDPDVFVAETLPAVDELVTTLVAETLPAVDELVTTLVAETLPAVDELVTTLVAETLPAVDELVTTLVAETLPAVDELVTTLVAETLPAVDELVTTLVAETLPFTNETVNTLITESILFNQINTSIIPTFVPPHIELPLPSSNQDRNQKLSVLCTLVLELYRMLSSSLLILFVPQSCRGKLCSISDNMKWNPRHHTYNFGICLNFITLFTFSCLYYIELKRENRLIKYLDVNPDMPSSNSSVQKTLENITIDKKHKILSIDKYYQRISYISIAMYIFNTIVSSYIISHYYLGGQTTTTLITSLLFMFTKLLNVYNVSNTEEHIFYSGYMKTFVQFNDLDKKHKITDIL